MVIPLMLATLTDRRDFGDDWLLERKFDGERCVARKAGSDVLLESRTGKDLTDGHALRGTDRTQTDQSPHLAKVRVAGSNPVFRSIVPAQRRCFIPDGS